VCWTAHVCHEWGSISSFLCTGNFTLSLSHPHTLACLIDVLATGQLCPDPVCQLHCSCECVLMQLWLCAAAELQHLLQHSVKCHPTCCVPCTTPLFAQHPSTERCVVGIPGLDMSFSVDLCLSVTASLSGPDKLHQAGSRCTQGTGHTHLHLRCVVHHNWALEQWRVGICMHRVPGHHSMHTCSAASSGACFRGATLQGLSRSMAGMAHGRCCVGHTCHTCHTC
jgi:hypothetical protein